MRYNHAHLSLYKYIYVYIYVYMLQVTMVSPVNGRYVPMTVVVTVSAWIKNHWLNALGMYTVLPGMPLK